MKKLLPLPKKSHIFCKYQDPRGSCMKIFNVPSKYIHTCTLCTVNKEHADRIEITVQHHHPSVLNCTSLPESGISLPKGLFTFYLIKRSPTTIQLDVIYSNSSFRVHRCFEHRRIAGEKVENGKKTQPGEIFFWRLRNLKRLCCQFIVAYGGFWGGSTNYLI